MTLKMPTTVDLDFAVIGFQKCGTCSIREYLRNHPEVAVPDGEFSPGLASRPWGPDRTPYQTYWDAIQDQLGDGREPGTSAERMKLGTVDPTYSLCDAAMNAKFLRASLGRLRAGREQPLRLVALVRPPLERAYSAWRMAHLAGGDDRSFDEAIKSCLVDGPSWTRDGWLNQSYIEAGEYKRIIGVYAKYFSILTLNLFDPEAEFNYLEKALTSFLGITSLGHGFPHLHKAAYPPGDPGPSDWARSIFDKLPGVWPDQPVARIDPGGTVLTPRDPNGSMSADHSVPFEELIKEYQQVNYQVNYQAQAYAEAMQRLEEEASVASSKIYTITDMQSPVWEFTEEEVAPTWQHRIPWERISKAAESLKQR